MYPKGTKIYDYAGELYATLTKDVFWGDAVWPDVFEFHQAGVSVKEGDPIPDPVWKLVIGEPYKPKD